jgi:hypothetical protein
MAKARHKQGKIRKGLSHYRRVLSEAKMHWEISDLGKKWRSPDHHAENIPRNARTFATSWEEAGFSFFDDLKPTERMMEAGRAVEKITNFMKERRGAECLSHDAEWEKVFPLDEILQLVESDIEREVVIAASHFDKQTKTFRVWADGVVTVGKMIMTSGW